MRRAIILGAATLLLGAWHPELGAPLLPATLSIRSMPWVPWRFPDDRLPIHCTFVNTGRDTLWLVSTPDTQLLDYVVRGNDYQIARALGCGTGVTTHFQPVAPGAAHSFTESVRRDPGLHVLQVILARVPRADRRFPVGDVYRAWSEPFVWPGPDRPVALYLSDRAPHGEARR